MTARDHEILDLLRDEPELLAVADAVATTQPRRRVPLPVLAMPILAVALVAVALFAPWQRSSPDFFDRALAAIGGGPVLHAVVRSEHPGSWHRVELATGKRAPPLSTETEIWYDRSRGLNHVIIHTNGRLTGELLQTPQGATSLEGPIRSNRRNGVPPPVTDPALGLFVTGYREALANGTARKVGEGKVAGKPVYWLDLKLASSGAGHDFPPIHERVAVDRATYRPLVVRTSGTGRGEYTVVRIETVSPGAANFSKPKRKLLPARERIAGGQRLDEKEVRLGNARDLLGVPGLWAGRRIAGLKLTKVTRWVLSTRYDRDTGLPPRRSQALELAYGRGRANDVVIDRFGQGENYLAIVESTKPPIAFNWPYRDPLWFVPPPGFVAIDYLGWGYLRVHGLYVKITTSLGERAVIEAARALRPIPASERP